MLELIWLIPLIPLCSSVTPNAHRWQLAKLLIGIYWGWLGGHCCSIDSGHWHRFYG